MQRDLFGNAKRMEPGLKEPVELDCAVVALTDHAALLRFFDGDGREVEAWVPLSLIRFRGNGQARSGPQVLDIERFKARGIGAI